jgi:hypothetical protein
MRKAPLLNKNLRLKRVLLVSPTKVLVYLYRFHFQVLLIFAYLLVRKCLEIFSDEVLTIDIENPDRSV